MQSDRKISKVQLHQQPAKYIKVEDGATVGAMVGRNLYDSDGKLITSLRQVITTIAQTIYTAGSSAVNWGSIGGLLSSQSDLSAALASLVAADVATLASANAYADGKVIDSIADGDATHAPSRNAVFDALTVKASITYVDAGIAFAIQRVNHTGTQPANTLSGTLQAAQFPALTGDVTTVAGALASTLVTVQGAAHTWSLTQTFTVAPVFTDQAGTRAALGLGTAATQPVGAFDAAGAAAAAQAASQPLDTTLTNLAAANWTANALPIGSGPDTVAQITFAANTFPARSSAGDLVAKPITNFGLSLVDDADAAAGRATLVASFKTDTETAGIPNNAAATFVDWNTPTANGFMNLLNGAANQPAAGVNWAALNVQGSNANNTAQLALPLGALQVWMRTKVAAVWGAWSRMAMLADVPNASYRTLMDSSASHTAARVAGTYWMGQGQPAGITGTGTLYPGNVMYIDPADYPAVNGLAAKLRVRATINANDVAPGGLFTVGLHPVTRPAASGGAGLVIYTVGAAVAGSTAAVTPALDSQNNLVGADFAVPAAGFYVLGFVTAANVAASAHVHISATLQMRNN